MLNDIASTLKFLLGIFLVIVGGHTIFSMLFVNPTIFELMAQHYQSGGFESNLFLASMMIFLFGLCVLAFLPLHFMYFFLTNPKENQKL